MMHGKQQQRAMPIIHASMMQNIAKNTSNARSTTVNLQIILEKPSRATYENEKDYTDSIARPRTSRELKLLIQILNSFC